jgi:DNA-directed RNA polymerase specialized sigma24 family protein
MRRPPSTPPSDQPVDQPVVILDNLPDAALDVASALGLSRAQLDEVINAMLVAAWHVGFPAHIHRLEVVSAGFITAISKPISERPSTKDWNGFVAWMCALAQCAAMTIRNSKHQRLLGQGHSDDEIGELLPLSSHEDRIAARELIRKAWPLLQPANREILETYYFDDKNTKKMAREQEEPSSTVSWRYRRALRNLRHVIKSMIAAILLFFTKKVRAQSVRLAQLMSRVFSPAAPTACVMTVTVTCGLMVPSGSMAIAASQGGFTSLVPLAPPDRTIAAATIPVAPTLTAEVEPEKPITIDELEKQCSACDMNPFKIARFLQASILPAALLVAPAVTQFACAGAEHQTPPPQEPEEPEHGGQDPYDQMCENERHRGDKCVSKADWCAKFGKRPATYSCK